MKRIYNKTQIQQELKKTKILNNFTNKNLSFFLVNYDVGETVISPDTANEFLHFVIDGTISIYSLRGDGSLYELSCSNQNILLGDMEFVTGENPTFWVETKTPVTTLCLSLRETRKELMSDVVFLHFIMNSLAEKVKTASKNEAAFCNLDDKLLHYIQYQCPNQCLNNVGNAALAIHCSRRQLQRILKRLTDKNVLIKAGKGKYRLCNQHDI